MELYETIFKRKSTRSFEEKAVEKELISEIESFFEKLVPLYPEIKVKCAVVDRKDVKCIFPWTPRQLVALYSQEKEGYLENAGFMLQMLDLFMQSRGLGACWLGMGRMDKEMKSRDGLKFVIMLAFGYPKGESARNDIRQFRRKKLSDISDRDDTHLEAARLAPSSVNSQPWYFTHSEDTIHAYCSTGTFPGIRAMSYMNRIDMGIALLHIYISNPETFKFFKNENPPTLRGYSYVGSFKI